MSSKQKTAKPPQDPYAQRGKTLASSVQRLRGWVGTDHARAPELADALVALTAHRLLGHGYAAAANDAQESVRRAAELLTAPGPIGPYTSVGDAGRYVTAVVHLATLQAGIGQAETAGRTLESLQPLHGQLGELGLELALEPTTAVWALTCSARAALAGGDLAAANSYADAAAAQPAGPRHDDDPDLAAVAVDVDRLVADCRWAAGRPADSLALLHRARLRYEDLVDGRLATPGRLSPALLERLAEPLFGLYRDLADRLVVTGETDTGLDVRRVLIETLRVLAPRVGDRAQVQLALTLSDLAADLALVDRLGEADDVAAEAAALAREWPAATPGRWWVTTVQARVAVRAGRAAEAVDALRPLADAVPDGSRSAAQAVALRTLAEALRESGDPEAAAATEQTYRDLATELVPTGSSDAVLNDRARGVVSRGAGPVSWSPVAPGNPYAPDLPVAAAVPDAAPDQDWRHDSDAWLESGRAEAHRREASRQEQAQREAERIAAEQRDAERVAAEQRTAERARAEEAAARAAERRAAAEAAERVERKRRREERLDGHRREQLRREIDQLAADAAVGDPTAAQQRDQRLAELAELDHGGPTAASAGAEPEPSGPAPVGSPPEPEARPQTEPRREPVPAPEVAEPVLPEPVLPEPVLPEPVLPEPVLPKPVLPEPVLAEPAGPVPAGRAEAPDELDLVEQAWADARARGDRRAARSANDRVVELLRSRAEADPAAYVGRLQEALEALASARLRGGDVFGSRSAAREARALARRSDR